MQSCLQHSTKKILFGALVQGNGRLHLHLECISPVCSPCLEGDIKHPEGLQRLFPRMVTGFEELTDGWWLQKLSQPHFKVCREEAELFTAFTPSTGKPDLSVNVLYYTNQLI